MCNNGSDINYWTRPTTNPGSCLSDVTIRPPICSPPWNPSRVSLITISAKMLNKWTNMEKGHNLVGLLSLATGGELDGGIHILDLSTICGTIGITFSHLLDAAGLFVISIKHCNTLHTPCVIRRWHRKSNLDRVVSQATHDLLLVVLQTVDALARLAAALNALHLTLTSPPVVFNLLHGNRHQLVS